MRAGEDPEPTEEGGDPACWAHLFEDEEASPDLDGGEGDGGPDADLPGA